MRGVAPLVVLASAVAAARSVSNGTRASAHGRYGVAYTRNGIRGSEERRIQLAEMRFVTLSASSLRSHAGATPIALFTDIPPALAQSLARELSGGDRDVFDVVLADGFAGFSPRSPDERALLTGVSSEGAAPALAAAFAKRGAKVRSRLGRLLNLGRAPFDLTLYVDDDTFFCAPPPSVRKAPLKALLLHFYETRDRYAVRAHVFKKDGADAADARAAARCVWRKALTNDFSAVLEARCAEAFATHATACSGAQGGALAVAAGPKAALFAGDWAEAFLDKWVAAAALPHALDRGVEHAFGSDQWPLQDLMARECASGRPPRWDVGPLPRSANVRTVDYGAGEACKSPVFGPVVFLHHKRYVKGSDGIASATDRAAAACARANRPHGDGGSVWLGRRNASDAAAGAPNATRGVKCGWMTAPGAPKAGAKSG